MSRCWRVIVWWLGLMIEMIPREREREKIKLMSLYETPNFVAAIVCIASSRRNCERDWEFSVFFFLIRYSIDRENTTHFVQEKQTQNLISRVVYIYGIFPPHCDSLCLLSITSVTFSIWCAGILDKNLFTNRYAANIAKKKCNFNVQMVCVCVHLHFLWSTFYGKNGHISK